MTEGERAAECGVGMKLASDALKIVTQDDAELMKRPPLRAGEPSPDLEADPNNLMGLLGEIDGLKQEIHERMRRVEAVKQAKSVLLEDAVRTEALNKRLAEIGKVMSSVHPGSLAAEANEEDAEVLRMQTRESHPEIESRPASARIQSEGVTLPWRRPDEAPDSVLHIQLAQVEQLSETASLEFEQMRVAEVASAAFEMASQRLEEAEKEWQDAWSRSDEAAVEAKRLLDDAVSRLDVAVQKEEQAAVQLDSVREEVSTAYSTASQRLEEAEQGWKNAWKLSDEAALEAKRLLEDSVSRLDAAVSREERAAAQFYSVREEVATAYGTASRRLEEAERVWSKTEAAAREAGRLFEESTARLEMATGREEQASAELHSAQETLTTTYQSAGERLEEAKRLWQQTDQAIREAKQILDKSNSELEQAKKKEESIAASIQSVRQEFTTAYQSASQRLEEAEKFWQKGEQAAQGAQNLIDQATAELLQSRSAEEKAAADLYSARQELTTAYQFASVAAQRRLDAAEFFQKAARLTVIATAFSWVAMVWAVWFALRTIVPRWAPGLGTVGIISLAFAFGRMKTRDV